MSERELLQEYLDYECERIFASSDNYAMTIPKKGMEEVWRNAQEKKRLLEQMLEGLER